MLIGELSRTCDCPVETIRYYERIGLLPPACRRPNGYRTYEESHATLLRFIVRVKHLGFSQDETRELMELAQQENPPCADVFAIVDKQYRDVRKRIAQLRQMEKTLLQLKNRCCNGTLVECPLFDELMQ
jgi:MerR family mercuric resistance operon transcriptional regulator